MSEQNIRQLLDSAIKYGSMNNISTAQYECLIRYFKTNYNQWVTFVQLFDSGKQSTVIKLLLSDNSVCGRVAPQPSPQPPSQPFAFACSPDIGCHRVNESPNKARGLFSDMQSCNSSCAKPAPPRPSQPFAFACSPGLGCHRVNESPNKARGLFSDIQSCNSSCAKPAPSINTLPDHLVGVGGRGLMGLGFGTSGFEDRTVTDQNLINRYKAPGKGSCANFPSPYPSLNEAPIWENYINEPSCKVMDYRTAEDKKMLLNYNNMAVSSYNNAYPGLNAKPTWN